MSRKGERIILDSSPIPDPNDPNKTIGTRQTAYYQEIGDDELTGEEKETIRATLDWWVKGEDLQRHYARFLELCGAEKSTNFFQDGYSSIPDFATVLPRLLEKTAQKAFLDDEKRYKDDIAADRKVPITVSAHYMGPAEWPDSDILFSKQMHEIRNWLAVCCLEKDAWVKTYLETGKTSHVDFLGNRESIMARVWADPRGLLYDGGKLQTFTTLPEHFRAAGNECRFVRLPLGMPLPRKISSQGALYLDDVAPVLNHFPGRTISHIPAGMPKEIDVVDMSLTYYLKLRTFPDAWKVARNLNLFECSNLVGMESKRGFVGAVNMMNCRKTKNIQETVLAERLLAETGPREIETFRGSWFISNPANIDLVPPFPKKPGATKSRKKGMGPNPSA